MKMKRSKNMYRLLTKVTPITAVAVACIGAMSPAQSVIASDYTHRNEQRVAGDVFILSNSTDEVRGNEIVMYNRRSDGTLILNGRFPTGGVGSGPAPTSSVTGGPLPVAADGLGSQNSLILSWDRRCLFAVNGGSNTVSSFRIFRNRGLRRVSTVDSGGTFPASLTNSKRVLFVLNAGLEGNITGFRTRNDCSLSPLHGASQSLNEFTDSFPEPEPNEVLTTPAQISFTPDGRRLVVSIKGGPDSNLGGRIVVFPVYQGGRAIGPGVATELSVDENTGGPFGFVFGKGGQLIVTHVNSFTISSYVIARDNTLKQISGPIPTGFDFPCWIVTSDGFVYVANFGSIPGSPKLDGPGVITGFSVARDGTLSPLGENAVATFPDTTNGNHAIDLAVVDDGRDGPFLYATQPRTGSVGIWQINDRDGSLKELGNVGGLVPGLDPNAPETLEFTEHCFLSESPAPECETGSPQGIVGY